MKKNYTILAALFVLFITNTSFSQALSGNYTIGNSSANYPTFLSAITALQAQGVGTGGAIFTIQPGTYNEKIVLENIAGLSETSRLTFFAAPATVSIQAQGTGSSSDSFIRVNSLSFVTFDGIRLIDSSVSVSEIEYGYYFLGSTTAGCANNIIKNGSIFLGASGARPIVTTRGIFFSSAGVSLATSNSNNSIDNMSIDNSSWGIQFRCAASFFGQITQADFNNQVINSRFGVIQSLGHDFSSGALAINALGGRNMLIKNNIIGNIENLNSAPSLPVSTTGISLDSCSGEVSSNVINKIEYQGTIGAVFGIRSSTFLGDTTLILNNKISGLIRSNFTASTTDPSFTITGIWIFSQSGNNGLARVLHNSIFLSSANPLTYSSAGINLSGGSTGQFPGQVFNNIVVNNIATSSSSYRSFALVDGNTNRGFLISNNNILFANGANGFLGGIGRELGGTEQFSNNLQDFISFSQTNANSVSFLPDFVNASAGDLSFSPSLIATSAYLVPTLTEVPLDILQITRRTPSTFSGAYEGTELLKIQNNTNTVVTIYPNPATDFVNVSLPNTSSTITGIQIFDQVGKQVLQFDELQLKSETNTFTIPVSTLQSGIYYLKLSGESMQASAKFIVE